MSASVRSLPAWTEAYAKLRDRIATFPAEGVIRSVNHLGEDVEVLRYWPSSDWQIPADANRLVFLGARDEAAVAALRDQGWRESARMSLLAGKPDDVEQVVKLPDTSVLFEAPMDDYDIVEVTDFDRPVAQGRMHYGSNFALLSEPDLHGPSDPDLARRAILANFAGAAYSHGIPWLLLVASGEQAETLAEGWSKATDLSFWQQG